MSCKCTETKTFEKNMKLFFQVTLLGELASMIWKLEMFIITQPHPHSPEDLGDIRFVMHPYDAESQPKMNIYREKSIFKENPKNTNLPPPPKKRNQRSNHVFSYR